MPETITVKRLSEEHTVRYEDHIITIEPKCLKVEVVGVLIDQTRMSFAVLNPDYFIEYDFETSTFKVIDGTDECRVEVVEIEFQKGE